MDTETNQWRVCAMIDRIIHQNFSGHSNLVHYGIEHFKHSMCKDWTNLICLLMKRSFNIYSIYIIIKIPVCIVGGH